MAKNQNFQKSLFSSLHIHGMNLYAGFWVNLTTQWLKFCVGAQNFCNFLPQFSIHFAKNARKRPNFDASYLGNRRELRGK